MSPDFFQQEERSTYEIWAPSENNVGMKQQNDNEQEMGIKKVNLMFDLLFSHSTEINLHLSLPYSNYEADNIYKKRCGTL